MNKDYVYAAIAGDIAGSKYETTYPENVPDLKTMLDQGMFTDDTILTMAVMDSSSYDMYWSFKKWARKYERCGFSKNFTEHFFKKDEEENSHSSSNGALMMLSPLLDEDTFTNIESAVRVSHDCHEAVWLAKEYWKIMKGETSVLEDCKVPYPDLLKEKKFCIDSFETLNRALIILEWATDFEDGIRKAILLGGDTDTQAAVVAPMLCKKFGLPDYVKNLVNKKLTGEMIELLNSY